MTDSATPTSNPTPRTIILPDFFAHCSFEYHAHEDMVKAVYESKAWMFGGSNIGRNEKATNALHGLKAAELFSTCWAFAPYHRMRACCDFGTWLFHLDDISDDMDDRSTEAIAKEVMATLNNPDTYHPKTYIGKLTESYWTRVRSEATPGAQKRFIDTMDSYFEAVILQARNRAAGIIPNLEDYKVTRRDTSGCRQCWALLEYGYGLHLPDKVMEDPIIQSLGEATNDFVSWTNDIYSYNREQARSDTHNMVSVVMHHHGMSLHEAVDFVGNQCDESLRRFIEDRQRLPSWGPEIDEQVQTYVRSLADWFIGGLHWSFSTERYFGKKGSEIKKSRVVELLPMKIPKAVVHAGLAQEEPEDRAG